MKAVKVAVIGAGAVGTTLAQRIIESSIADVVLVDIAINPACGKALDLTDAAPIVGHERTITATDDFRAIEGCDLVAITAGFPRKPGMSREELLLKNSETVNKISINIRHHSPESIVIVVTNPLDAMTYLTLMTTGFSRKRVMGMAGVLDGARFAALIAEELKIERRCVETYVLGSHGDTMVPVISNTTVSGQPITRLLSKEAIDALVKRTQNRGAEIVSLLGTGSAYYSPSASVFKMINAIVSDTREVITASVFLEGEYGQNDICVGVPCRLGRDGMQEVIELSLSDAEKKAFENSARVIRDTTRSL